MTGKILVVDRTPKFYGAAIEGLGRLTSNHRRLFKSPEKFILVLFTGGADVDPSLYNDTSPAELCSTNIERDKFETIIFKHALENNIPMIGICRGFQFLNVMAGGRLMHHIDGHGGSIHGFDSPRLKKEIRVNSFHHQMVIPNAEAHTIGWSVETLSDIYYGKKDEKEEWGKQEVESCIFPEIRACGVQYHPEWMPKDSGGALFFYNLADRLIHWPMNKVIQIYTKGSEDAKAESNIVHTCLSNTA